LARLLSRLEVPLGDDYLDVIAALYVRVSSDERTHALQPWGFAPRRIASGTGEEWLKLRIGYRLR